MLTKKVAFEKRTALDAIQLFDRNYSEDLQKSGFLENFRYIFTSIYTVKFAFAMKDCSKNINPEFSTSHNGPPIAMITYHKYPATTIYRYWSKCLNWYVGVGHEYC